MKNWKTTTCGVAVILGAICSVVASALDGNPNTVPDIPSTINVIVVALGGMGLMFARDGKDNGKGSAS